MPSFLEKLFCQRPIRRIKELESSQIFPEKPQVVAKISFGNLYDTYLQPLPVTRGIEIKDATYDVLTPEAWQIFADANPARLRPYETDLFDCDNYATATEYWAYEWGYKNKLILPLGSIMGFTPSGASHAWNILYTSKGLAFLDHTPNWPWTGKVHLTGGLWEGKFTLVWM